MKKIFLTMLLVITVLSAGAAFASDVPVINAGYTMTTHQEAFMVAMSRGEAFKSCGVWFKPVVEKEKYDLYEDGKKIARFNIIVTKSGSEATALFAQGHLDITTNSIPAMLSAIDQGTKIKIISPLQSDAIAMVSRNDIDIRGWDGFSSYVKKSKKPVVVGYHSPTSAPKIVFEAAMAKSGFKITEDANATKANADILMMDLKSIANVIPALTANQVEFAVVPSPTPEIVENKKQGHIVLQMKELPPAGAWKSFPCCCVAASEAMLEKQPEITATFLKLISYSSDWCMKDKHDAAVETSNWLGVPANVIEKADIEYSTKVTKKWLKNAALYPDILNKLGQLTGRLKGKKLNDVKSLVFDFNFNKVKK